MLDLCIRNGLILDGSGASAMRMDLGIMDGRIVAMGDLSKIPAFKDLDAAGKTVCPGFLDMHRHADAAIFLDSYGDCDLYQGITTIGNGNCGLSLIPQFGPHAEAVAAYLKPVTGEFAGITVDSLSSYHEALKKRPMAVNALMLAGGGTIRASVAGFQKTVLEKEDFRQIHSLLEKALAEGAAGVSLGLGYAPECFYSTEELIKALEPLAGSNTVVSVHLREEAMRLLPSIDEMLTVAKKLKVPLQISHLKATGKENWNRLAPIALERIGRAREEGVDVFCDVYAYTAGSTQLMAILPPEFLKGGNAAITQRLKDASLRSSLINRLKNGRDFDNYSLLVGWETIFVSAVKNPEDAEYVGRSLADSAGNTDPAVFTLDLLARNNCEVTMIDFITTESDIATILQSPLSYVISDATFPTGGKLHPRVYGAFSNVIEEYVFKRHALTIEQAINKMTMRPADRYGLTSKGRIAVGADADILIFEPEKVHVAATYNDPHQPSCGMDHVLINGIPVLENGVRTGVSAGKVLEGRK